jgi:hypothetical protein
VADRNVHAAVKLVGAEGLEQPSNTIELPIIRGSHRRRAKGLQARQPHASNIALSELARQFEIFPRKL